MLLHLLMVLCVTSSSVKSGPAIKTNVVTLVTKMPKTTPTPPTIPPTRIPSNLPTRIPTSLPTRLPTNSPTPTDSYTSYRGGPVLYSPMIYTIFYGNWANTIQISMQNAIVNFVSNLGNTSFFNILTTYYGISANISTPLTNQITFGGWVVDNYSQGPNLTRTTLGTVVALAQATHLLPSDPQGIFAVLTSGDVLMDGMCTQFCGFHANYGGASSALIYASVATACPSGCAPPQYFGNSVNGQLTDGLINVLSHEIFEAMTDPRNNAWKPEIADVCEWNFGPILTTSGGLTYNVILQNNFQVYIQGVWVNANGGYCATHYP